MILDTKRYLIDLFSIWGEKDMNGKTKYILFNYIYDKNSSPFLSIVFFNFVFMIGRRNDIDEY